jgi:hypothetical protein
MNATIDGVQVTHGTNGARLGVVIPSGMTGKQLVAWKAKNQAAITTATATAQEAPTTTQGAPDASNDEPG